MDTEIEAVRDKLAQIFGLTTMVRFRSSSNAEDVLEFNGAGLYESVSVCPGDRENQSIQCGSSGRETIEEGFEKVYRSLHGNRAVSERLYYKLPNASAKMAILVTPRFDNEHANGVAYTGSPTDRDDKRYVIYAQRGDTSVVAAEDGVAPERNILTVEADGSVTEIVRASRSTSDDVGPCEDVLTDGQLIEMGAVMRHFDDHFSVDTGDYCLDLVLKDIEFKWDSSNPPQLKIKQIRPLLIRERMLPFLRGDVNGDGSINVIDGMLILNWKHSGIPEEQEPACFDTMDFNDDGTINTTDGIALLNFAFGGGNPPEAPYPEKGRDPTPDCIPACTTK